MKDQLKPAGAEEKVQFHPVSNFSIPVFLGFFGDRYLLPVSNDKTTDQTLKGGWLWTRGEAQQGRDALFKAGLVFSAPAATSRFTRQSTVLLQSENPSARRWTFRGNACLNNPFITPSDCNFNKEQVLQLIFWRTATGLFYGMPRIHGRTSLTLSLLLPSGGLNRFFT